MIILKKILMSNHLFYDKMCSYHNGVLGRGINDDVLFFLFLFAQLNIMIFMIVSHKDNICRYADQMMI